ncbi:MAG: ABC transporter permease subunit, partial [Alphaproteobacteria bacterium]
DGLGLKDWCAASESGGAPMSLADLVAKSAGGDSAPAPSIWDLPFPSLDELHKACGAIPQTRDMTLGLEEGFLGVKDWLRIVLDPLTQPLSWMLDGALTAMLAMPWWLVFPLAMLAVFGVTRSLKLVGFVAASLALLAFIDHYDTALQTLSIIFVCAFLCVLFGVPIGIAMARNDYVQRAVIPILDMLQTLPPFVYLIPLIFLFSVTEPKLYGIAIILYAIVPVIRLTDLGIRLVDRDVIEAADAFGMTERQRLFGVQIPLALPNIMAGVNQTIMMSLAMVVIASLVSAPGLGVLVLRGIRNLELGVGLVAGLAIVLLAVMLDRVT